MLDWKIGVEIELLAPLGASRETLAHTVAERVGGTATRIFHPESELSAVPGQPVFENLTLGYRVDGPDGEWIASFVDDLTLQADLFREARPKPGWYRIVSNDPRLLRLAARHCDASEPLETVLQPFADLFGVEPEQREGDMIRVQDSHGASLAIGAPLPGERERPCEIVTAPIARDHEEVLGALLTDALELGFTAPKEGATHIHFDAAPLTNASFIARFVRLVRLHGAALRDLVGVNPNCVRLGNWPEALDRLVFSPEFAELAWDTARARLLDEAKLNKYCDFNLRNMIDNSAQKHTLEVRILPTLTDAGEIVRAAALFEGVIRLANDPKGPIPETLSGLIAALPLEETARKHWLAGG